METLSTAFDPASPRAVCREFIFLPIRSQLRNPGRPDAMRNLLRKIKRKILGQPPPRARRPESGCGHYGPAYWENRKGLKYYQEVIRLAKKYEPHAERAIDVGGYITRVIHQMDWIPHRMLLDIQEVPPDPEVEVIRADFMAYDPGAPLDLVLCLQVLEHLEDPAPFARKLLATGRTLILAVPFRWPSGMVRSHIQDPVDEAKLKQWIGCDPIESTSIRDRNRDRLVAVYRREA